MSAIFGAALIRALTLSVGEAPVFCPLDVIEIVPPSERTATFIGGVFGRIPASESADNVGLLTFMELP